jgi:hypothetical protein
VKRRKHRPRTSRRRPELSIPQILCWADAWRERTGEYPHARSGGIPETLGETWWNIEANLRRGGRGLPYRTTLARLLADHRGARNHMGLPALTVPQILAWAEAHYEATGEWPHAKSGPIAGTREETWLRVETALRDGLRGLPGGSSLAQLLAQHFGARNIQALPPLTQRQILAWADAHHQRSGKWPTKNSGPIEGAPGETWSGVHTALYDGLRGFRGGSSLARFLARRRGVRNQKALPRRTIEEVLAWADVHQRRTGEWPTKKLGPIVRVRGESWKAIDQALRHGLRGFPPGLSLARLLARYRGVRNSHGLPALTEKQILAWADAHRRRTGEWPTKKSGLIAVASETTWMAVDSALHKGGRGLPGGTTLRRLLEQQHPTTRPATERNGR